MTIVRASGAVMDSMGALGLLPAYMSDANGDLAMVRSQLKRTSSVVKLRPLVGGRGSSWAFWRSFMVRVRPSGENSNDSASSPTTGPSTGLPLLVEYLSRCS